MEKQRQVELKPLSDLQITRIRHTADRGHDV